MAWYKVDDRLPTSRKLMRIPRRERPASIGVWTIAGAWSMHEMTDGFVPAYMLEEWGGDESNAATLVSAGMWEEDERDGDPGWQFVNWDEYQPTKADVEARRERDRERKRSQPRGKGGKFAGRTVDATDSARNPDGTGTDSRGNISDSTVPLPSPPHPTPSSALKRAETPPEGFDAWWAQWPKKVAKAAALRAYKTALKKTDALTLGQKAAAFITAEQRKGTAIEYIPNASTWLNQERWEDDTSTPPAMAPKPEWMKYV